ncbi:DUF1499 domain-containing protein [Celeribacter marinus]|uniref:Uncharacterized protein n=1 Tax=Celeribacter marinus TaxID=1397108 RepID=A0A0P0A8Z7_9RHOB|nr:DUF1499 domain-containing protein [Celeribacter marinus]ALI54254.1 hypothetical protein IMCC12053_304 [Celeribacter marinus]SFK33180.1 Protein of unknown function [Celeribacter marinus]
MKLLLLSGLGALALLVGYIRLAPTDAARWHIDPFVAADPAPGGARDLFQADIAPSQVLTRLARVAEATARTRLIAGSIEEGRMTYMTRSKLWGFPDFTTFEARAGQDGQGADVAILARLRFGSSDMGVNAARIAAWRAAAGL